MNALRSVTLISWNSRYFIVPQIVSLAGPAQDAEPIIVVDHEADSGELGHALQEGLSSFREVHLSGSRTSRTRSRDPLLVASGATSRTQVWKEGLLCEVLEYPEEYRIHPSRKGKARGTWLFKKESVVIPRSATVQTLGEGAMAALQNCNE